MSMPCKDKFNVHVMYEREGATYNINIILQTVILILQFEEVIQRILCTLHTIYNPPIMMSHHQSVP